MAQQQYHLNPKTGNPNICRAKPDKCPYGPVPHYGSKEEARAAYEDSQQDELLSPTAQIEVVLGENGYLRDDIVELAAPRGVHCPHCGAATTAREASVLIGNELISCHGCEKRYDLVEAKIELTPENSSYKFLKDEEVLASTWFHATGEEEWMKEIWGDPESFEVHVGTEAAAFDRALTEYASHGDWGRSFYLYEITLAPDSSIKSGVEDDENGKLLEEGDADVARYVNRWEDMASISLAVKPGKVIVGKRRQVSVDEAHRRLTPYNVGPLKAEEDTEEKPESLGDYIRKDQASRLAALLKEEEDLKTMDEAAEIFDRAMENFLNSSDYDLDEDL